MLYQRGGKQTLQCRNCNYSRELGRNTDQIKDRKMTDGIDLKEFMRGMGTKLNESSCKRCKSVISTINPEKIEICPFCLGTEFDSSNKNESVILPREILPFSVPKEVARKKLKSYFRRGEYRIMYPNDMVSTVTNPDNIRGVYVPFFLFDVFTQTTWKGEGSFKYGGQGKALWDHFSGFFENFYENVEVPATNGLNMEYLGNIMPFYMRDTVHYDYHYLKEWATEIYLGDEKSRFEEADAMIDGQLAGEINRRIKANEQKNLKQATEKQNITFRHALVPVWVSIYTYQGKNFQFLVNGQTGRVTGEKPISFNKIYTAIGLIVLLVLIIVFSFS
ncbi:MAG: hypothetical protein KDE26_13175 [Bacteroidetes bacterium]|nr:hypothetical protein [Bacteroidota bacterium]